ncbi:MAG: HEAT repeat domain-containing protein, partial [Planctomycetota bacterium]
PVPTPTPEPVAPAASHDAPVLGLPAALAEAARKLAAGDPAVRFEGVDELQRSKDAAAVPLLLPLLRDPDPFVRRLVAEGFAAHKRADVVEGLLAALGDADEYVRDTAWRSLKDVTGQKLPFESAGTKDARARATARWQEWWDKNKAGFGA